MGGVIDGLAVLFVALTYRERRLRDGSTIIQACAIMILAIMGKWQLSRLLFVCVPLCVHGLMQAFLCAVQETTCAHQTTIAHAV